jgi:hypothetical protein
MATTLTVFEGWDLETSDVEDPRARDIDIAERAGLAEPANVRRVIDANWEELSAHGEIRVLALSAKTPGRPGREYWLNEDQAVALVALMRTPAARALRINLVRVFGLYRRGLQAAPLPLDVAHGIRLRDEPRLKADMRALCGMTARSTGCTLQAIYGFVRKTYRVGSPFDVAAMAWPMLKATLEAVALGRLLLPTRARVLRLVAKPTATLPLPFPTA